MIDGRVFDDDTEEWTILNTDQQYHSFHLHQTPFLVAEVNGMPQDEDSLRDTASIPPATGAGPGVLKVVMPFTDPEIVGPLCLSLSRGRPRGQGHDGYGHGRALILIALLGGRQPTSGHPAA
jgi:hypothetical protein